MKLDILAVGAHPDDVELSCSGTIAKAVERGKKVGLRELNRVEVRTMGRVENRDAATKAEARRWGV